MKKRVLTFSIILLVLSLSYSLYKISLKVEKPIEPILEGPITPVVEEPITPNNEENSEETDEEIPDTDSPIFYAPFTGEEISEEHFENIPFMAIIENSRAARPQSGLSQADIVYETSAEGGIPRFMAVFQKNSPKEIGPIRSVRPYFIDISKEYGLPFGHCGGSEEALNTIRYESLMSMNEMRYGSCYYRDKSRRAPHNLYTSSKKLRSLVTSKDYKMPSNFFLQFNSEYWNNSDLATALKVSIKVSNYYSTQYEFKEGNYYKLMDNKPATDRSNNKAIDMKNIIIQITDIKLQEDGNHLDIDLVGEGEGYVISNGKYMKIKWFRKDLESNTVITDENGESISLNPGKTWWNIIDKKSKVTFEKVF
jgi:hypothetical protein